MRKKKETKRSRYRRLTIVEIREILEAKDIVRRIKSQQLQWYINRESEQSVIREITTLKSSGSRPN